MKLLKALSVLMVIPVGCIALSAAGQQTPPVQTDDGRYSILYGSQFSDYYPEIVKAAPDLAGTPLEAPVTVTSEFSNRKATLVRSDGAKVPYSDEVGVVTIESNSGGKQFLIFRRFRNIDMKWINDRLLYFSVNLGPVANVEALFDSETAQWIYRQGVSFTVAPAGPSRR